MSSICSMGPGGGSSRSSSIPDFFPLAAQGVGLVKMVENDAGPDYA